MPRPAASSEPARARLTLATAVGEGDAQGEDALADARVSEERSSEPTPAVGAVAQRHAAQLAAEGAESAEDQWEDEETRPTGLDGRKGRAAVKLSTGGPVAVRIAPNGQVLQASDETLADAVAYAARIGGLIGEMLGLEELQAIDCASRTERLVMFTDQEGDLVALRLPATADMAVLRERLGL